MFSKPMTAIALVFLLISGFMQLSGCTSIIHAVTDEPFEPDPAETSVGTDVDDWQMETLIGVNIKKADPGLEQSHIKVDAYNAVILLTGEVASTELRALAGDTARKFRGVRQVHNELTMQGSSSLLDRTNDGWLTTKVKSKLIAYKDIESSKIKVVTSNGVVYLMGTVTRDQANRATQVTSTTRGVQKVVKVFEYLD